MVAEAAVWFEDHKVESERESWQELATGQRPAVQQAVRSGADPRALPMVDRFLGQPEIARTAPANLDHDQSPWRPGVDSHEVELVATHAHVPAEDRPAIGFEAARDVVLGRIAGPLLVGSRHGGSLAARP
jgi:hypothetical protein